MTAVYLVDGKRTPQAKAGMVLKNVSPPFLASPLLKKLRDFHGIPSSEVDEVVVGNVGNPPHCANVARVIALEGGLEEKISAYTVHRNCASGLEALAQGFLKISSGRAHVVFAGGVESMSQMPLFYSKEMTVFFMGLMRARTMMQKLGVLKKFRPQHLKPIVALELGLTDPFCGLNMGQTAEVLAREFDISREEQDEFANRSHQLAIEASEKGRAKEEIVGILSGKNLDEMLTEDVGPRKNSSVEKLSQMKPFFDRKSGTVTIGNSCPITDGGAMWLMCSEEAVKRYNLEPMARLVDFHFSGIDPKRMGLGPVPAMEGVFKASGMKISEMEAVEINEAFAAQVLSVLKVAKEKKLAQRFGCEGAVGEIPLEKLNGEGGGIALGHPVGATGARIVVTLAHRLKRQGAKFGLASLCVGGGQGGALIIENLASGE